MRRMLKRSVLVVALLSASHIAAAQGTANCSSCAEWNAPHRPFRVYGNTFYVGTNGLSAMLITSSAGHILIDGGLAESAPVIIEHIRDLGFRVEDVKLILNSHAHHDHAAGIAAIQHASKAVVAASPWSARVIERGSTMADDPQFGLAPDFPAARDVRVISDGEILRVGPLALVAHFTPGHTPGGTSWSWQSCEADRCLDLVYADSQTPVSADGFLFTKNQGVAQFERGFKTLELLRCDVLITPHPSASAFFERVATQMLVEPEACRRYVANARTTLANRVSLETDRPGVAR